VFGMNAIKFIKEMLTSNGSGCVCVPIIPIEL
jgi:hypothetical protein